MQVKRGSQCRSFRRSRREVLRPALAALRHHRQKYDERAWQRGGRWPGRTLVHRSLQGRQTQGLLRWRNLQHRGRRLTRARPLQDQFASATHYKHTQTLRQMERDCIGRRSHRNHCQRHRTCLGFQVHAEWFARRRHSWLGRLCCEV